MATVLPGRIRPGGTPPHAPSAAEEAEYERLRGLARTAQNKRKLCIEQSKAAFNSGQRARAKELSNEAKKNDRLAKEYHRQARDYIFRVHNVKSGEDEIDLHGLYVDEAKDVLRTRINAEKARGGSGIHVIVGKGIHSPGNTQKIKPAVEQLCRELKLQVLQEQNAGRLYISMGPAKKPASKPEAQKPKVHTPPRPAPVSPRPVPQQQQQLQQQQQQQQQRISSGGYVAPGYVAPSYAAQGYVAPSYAAAPAPQNIYGTIPQRPTPQQHVRPQSYAPPKPPPQHVPQHVYPSDLESGRVDPPPPQESSLSRFLRGIFGGISSWFVRCIF